MKTIAVDFDGVVHAYSKGWQDGTVYDSPKPGAIESICKLMEQGYAVFIHSTRKPRQIKEWIIGQAGEGIFWVPDGLPCYPMYGIKIIPFWVKFWNKKRILGITRRKLPAILYIDDRGYRFESWEKTLDFIKDDKEDMT